MAQKNEVGETKEVSGEVNIMSGDRIENIKRNEIKRGSFE
jgi:hypothetical protein